MIVATDRRNSSLSHVGAALISFLLGGAICHAQTQAKITVDDVIPQGNHLVQTQKIISLIKTRPGNEYQQEVVDEDVRRLSETKLFANVKVFTQRTGENRIKVYFQVTEYPSTIQEIVYEGAKHLNQEELDTLTGLRRGAPLNPVANRMAVQAILRKYHEMGRIFAGVDLVEGDQPGQTRVVFRITEGRIVRISHIDFTGNTFVPDGRLRTQIDSSREIFGIGGALDVSKVDHDVSKLEEYYKIFGFHDIKVGRELQWEPDNQHVHVYFHINEGIRYRVVSIQMSGNKFLETDKLLTETKQVQGEYYNEQKLKTDQALIQAKYGYEGMAPIIQMHNFYPAPGEVAVDIQVQEKPVDHVGQIKIIGNTVTKDPVILRQLELYPGQILTYPDLRQAERNLARLGIFENKPETGSRPTVTVDESDSPGDYKTILVNVNETQTGSLMFGVGVNSDAGLVGTIVLNERNFDITKLPTSWDDFLSGHAFRGAGQEFRLEAVPGTQLQRYTASWRDPFIFDSLFSLQVSAYYWTRTYNEYTESRLGSRITLGRQLSKYWSTSATLRIEDVGVHNVVFYEPADIVNAEGQHFLMSARAAVTRDSRDSFLRPTEGSKVELAYEQFFGDYTFPQVSMVASKFFTLYERADGSGRQVLAARSEIDISGSHTPVFERYYAGGFSSMRGFEFRGVGPQIDGYKIGGDFMWLNSLEYQLPIMANDFLYAVAFLDSGTVESSVELKNYRVAAGVGLRINVPALGQVPIALDFGIPIVKAPGDNTQVFSFWVGFFR